MYIGLRKAIRDYIGMNDMKAVGQTFSHVYQCPYKYFTKIEGAANIA